MVTSNPWNEVVLVSRSATSTPGAWQETTATNLTTVLKSQLGLNEVKKGIALRVHEVKVWVFGAKDVPIPNFGLIAADLSQPYVPKSTVELLKTIEAAGTFVSPAYASFRWPRFQQEIVLTSSEPRTICAIDIQAQGLAALYHLRVSWQMEETDPIPTVRGSALLPLRQP